MSRTNEPFDFEKKVAIWLTGICFARELQKITPVSLKISPDTVGYGDIDIRINYPGDVFHIQVKSQKKPRNITHKLCLCGLKQLYEEFTRFSELGEAEGITRHYVLAIEGNSTLDDVNNMGLAVNPKLRSAAKLSWIKSLEEELVASLYDTTIYQFVEQLIIITIPTRKHLDQFLYKHYQEKFELIMGKIAIHQEIKDYETFNLIFKPQKRRRSIEQEEPINHDKAKKQQDKREEEEKKKKQYEQILRKAQSCEKLHDLVRAESYYRDALQIFSNAPEAIIGLVQVLDYQYLSEEDLQKQNDDKFNVSQGKLIEAQEWANKLLNIDGEDPYYQYLMGRILFKQYQLKPALEYLQLSFEQVPFWNEIWDVKSVAHFLNEDYREVISLSDRFLVVHPENVFHWYRLGISLLKQGFINRAHLCFENYRKIPKNDPDKTLDGLVELNEKEIMSKLEKEKIPAEKEIKLFSFLPEETPFLVAISNLRFLYKLYREVVEVVLTARYVYAVDETFNGYYLKLCQLIESNIADLKKIGGFPNIEWKIIQDLHDNEDFDDTEIRYNFVEIPLAKAEQEIIETFEEYGEIEFPLTEKAGRLYWQIHRNIPVIREMLSRINQNFLKKCDQIGKSRKDKSQKK